MRGFADPYLSEVGRVILAWAHLEQLFLTLFLITVVTKDKQDATASLKDPDVLAKMSLPLKSQVRAFNDHVAAIKGITQEHIDEVGKILDTLVRLRDERDEIAHSAFWVSEEASREHAEEVAVGLFKSWKDTKEPEERQVPLNRLKSMYERMHVLFEDLFALSLDPQTYAHFRLHT